MTEMTKAQLIKMIPTQGKPYSKKTLESYKKDKLIAMVRAAKRSSAPKYLS